VRRLGAFKSDLDLLPCLLVLPNVIRRRVPIPVARQQHPALALEDPLVAQDPVVEPQLAIETSRGPGVAASDLLGRFCAPVVEPCERGAIHTDGCAVFGRRERGLLRGELGRLVGRECCRFLGRKSRGLLSREACGLLGGKLRRLLTGET
jgi:hypothetical protein